jgi:hypothetical protein
VPSPTIVMLPAKSLRTDYRPKPQSLPFYCTTRVHPLARSFLIAFQAVFAGALLLKRFAVDIGLDARLEY